MSDSGEEINEIQWTVSGKVKRITRTSTSTKDDLSFEYDAMGQRIMKTVYPKSAPGVVDLANVKSYYYIRDAQGNTMALYNFKNNEFTLAEQYMYGSARLGVTNRGMLIDTPADTMNYVTVYNTLGEKQYELANHLGNVLVTVSDKKVVEPNGSMTEVAFYHADVSSANDYYPFGMHMPGRNGSVGEYRYGMNGKEKDDEIKGSGNSYDYGFRMYDPRIGRPLSLDPLTKHYPELSPYQFFSNNPIWFIDLDGLEGVQYLEITKMKDGTTVTKRIVEVDVFVATSKNVKSIHYKSADLPTIQSNLQSEYNKGFKDANGNEVEFRFNVQEFDADATLPSDKARQLRRDPNNYVEAADGTVAPKGFILQKGKLKAGTQGSTLGNLVTISNKASDPSHTQAHETGHVFLNHDKPNNPVTPKDNAKAGGIFKYKVVDTNGNTVSATEDVNQGNVDSILKALPELDSKTIEE